MTFSSSALASISYATISTPRIVVPNYICSVESLVKEWIVRLDPRTDCFLHGETLVFTSYAGEQHFSGNEKTIAKLAV
jgi:hypothetical protein